MIQRGVAYPVLGAATDAVVVALTRDRWNEKMHGVGVVPLVRAPASTPHASPLGDDYVAEIGRLTVIPQDSLGPPGFALDNADMHKLEIELGSLLAADRLLTDPPRGTRPPPGVMDYPRRGDVYYLRGQRIEHETKRYVVVSNDPWNQRKETVLVVRLTKQPKFPTDEFPEVGEGQACCGELAAVSAKRLDLRQRPAPGPTRLALAEMASIARGISITHVLRDHLAPEEVDLLA